MRTAFWLAAAAALALAGTARAGDTIKIGFVSTFSGPTAVIGKVMGDGTNQRAGEPEVIPAASKIVEQNRSIRCPTNHGNPRLQLFQTLQLLFLVGHLPLTCAHLVG